MIALRSSFIFIFPRFNCLVSLQLFINSKASLVLSTIKNTLYFFILSPFKISFACSIVLAINLIPAGAAILRDVWRNLSFATSSFAINIQSAPSEFVQAKATCP